MTRDMWTIVLSVLGAFVPLAAYMRWNIRHIVREETQKRTDEQLKEMASLNTTMAVLNNTMQINNQQHAALVSEFHEAVKRVGNLGERVAVLERVIVVPERRHADDRRRGDS
jgi:hypothetical protein